MQPDVTRRQFLVRGAAAAIGLGSAGAGLANDGAERTPDGSASKDMITPAVQERIDRGLKYLADHQRANGSFGENRFDGNVAVTSLCALSLMAAGNQPGRGRFGKNVTDALNYVYDCGDEDRAHPGYLNHAPASPQGPMYSHGFGTLFLGEVHGMIPDRELQTKVRKRLKEAVEVIIHSQNPEGGWRYTPDPKDADISVTICQIMALRSARNAGIVVPKSTADRCIEYVKACQDANGGFRYMKQGTPPAFARTAAGVVALFSAGVYKGPEIERGLHYLTQWRPNPRIARPDIHGMHYYYGQYYAAQAMWIAGGDYWKNWFPPIRDELMELGRMRNDGAWTDSNCSHYATAMACLVLQVANNYLPIFQK
jgi:hypothetical protein